MFTKYARGMVYWADIPKYDVNPNVQNGRRPVVIVSNNVANCVSNNVTIVPCTTNTDKNPEQPTHYIMALNSKEDSMVLCEDIITISKSLLAGFMGILDEHIMQEIDECLKVALNLTDVHNPLLGNTRRKDLPEKVYTNKPEKRKTGKRVAGKIEMAKFLRFYEENGTEKTMEEYGVPTKSAVQQRLQFYRKKV